MKTERNILIGIVLLFFAQSSMAMMRDGCTSIGADCTCSPAPGTPDECRTGTCFQGPKYNDSSVYCQCNLNVLDDNEVKDLQAKGPLPTDDACSAHWAFDYYGQGLTDLGNKLKALADANQLGHWSVSWYRSPKNLTIEEFAKASTNSPAEGARKFEGLKHIESADFLKNALDKVVQDAKSNLAQINSAAKSPSEIRLLDGMILDTFDSAAKPGEFNQRAYTWFKSNFLNAIGARTALDLSNFFIFEFTPSAEQAILATFKYLSPKASGDPCTCQSGERGKGMLQEKRTFKPGICRVNRCISPGILRCHCAD